MKKFTLTIILEDIRIGGPQKQLIYFLNSINKKKYNIILIIPNKNNKFFKELILNSNIKIIDTFISLPTKNNIFSYLFLSLYEIYNLKNILVKANTNILYVPGGSISIKAIIVSKLLNLKTIWHIHDCKSNFFIRMFFRLISHKNIKTIFASEKSRKYYQKNLDKKTYVIRSSVDTNILNKKLNKNKKKINVGFVANINPDKNIKLLFDIISKNNNKNIHFFLYGNIWNTQKKYYEGLIKNYPGILKKFKWYKNQYNSLKIFSKIDLLICTSKTESFPLSFSEALSFSIPIISTNVGDVNIFNKSKNKFFIILYKNHFSNFLKKIEFFLNNKKIFNKYQKNSRNYAINYLDIKGYKKKIINILENF